MEVDIMPKPITNAIKKLEYQLLKLIDFSPTDEQYVGFAQGVLQQIDTGDTIVDVEMPTTLLGCTLDWSAGEANDLIVEISKGDWSVTQDLGAANSTVTEAAGFTGTQQQKIQAGDTTYFGEFGRSVAVSSDSNYAIVGAEQKGGMFGGPGAAYVFIRSGSSWSQQQKLESTDKETGDFFGKSVSISSDGSYAIVGASGEDTPSSGAGAAYVFTRDGVTWTQQQKIQSDDIQGNDIFGYTVSISDDGDYAIVGAYYEDGGGGDPKLNAGAAYVFLNDELGAGDSWTQQQKIVADDSLADALFGGSVDISADDRSYGYT